MKKPDLETADGKKNYREPSHRGVCAQHVVFQLKETLITRYLPNLCRHFWSQPVYLINAHMTCTENENQSDVIIVFQTTCLQILCTYATVRRFSIRTGLSPRNLHFDHTFSQLLCDWRTSVAVCRYAFLSSDVPPLGVEMETPPKLCSPLYFCIFCRPKRTL